MIMRELNVKELPTYPVVQLTAELGVRYMDGRWERFGQQLIGPLSRLILLYQPAEKSFIGAACAVTGWAPIRVFAFQAALSQFRISVGETSESSKGVTDAALYSLLYKLARKRTGSDAGSPRIKDDHEGALAYTTLKEGLTT
jgi:hypothetical protein